MTIYSRLAGAPFRRRFSSKRYKRPSIRMSSKVWIFEDFNENGADYATPMDIPPPLPPRNKT